MAESSTLFYACSIGIKKTICGLQMKAMPAGRGRELALQEDSEMEMIIIDVDGLLRTTEWYW